MDQGMDSIAAKLKAKREEIMKDIISDYYELVNKLTLQKLVHREELAELEDTIKELEGSKEKLVHELDEKTELITQLRIKNKADDAIIKQISDEKAALAQENKVLKERVENLQNALAKIKEKNCNNKL